ncbi:MAG: hypothetical protein RIG68_18435 [Imperialibacter sp.]|uniref:hypothetical protein n=1 Tax=Imperialibacter sp. TaxID=2038411 RepID=UPI0032EE3D22
MGLSATSFIILNFRMKKAVLKALLFVVILVVIRQVISTLFPLEDRQSALNGKRTLLSTNKSFNTVILGSSRVERGVDPFIVDSMTARHHLKSLNLGFQSLTFPYINDISNQIVTERGADYLLVELTGPGLDFGNMGPWFELMRSNTTENSFSDILFLAQQMATSLKGVLSTRLNIVNFAGRYHSHKGLRQNGYLPYPDNLRDEEKLPNLINSRLTLDVHSGNYAQRKLQSKYHLEETIDKANDNGIRIIYILPPLIKDEDEATFIYEAFYELPEECRLNVYSAEFIELIMDSTKRKNYFHLNNEGAVLYSQILGEKLNEHLSKWPDDKKRGN